MHLDTELSDTTKSFRRVILRKWASTQWCWLYCKKASFVCFGMNVHKFPRLLSQVIPRTGWLTTEISSHGSGGGKSEISVSACHTLWRPLGNLFHPQLLVLLTILVVLWLVDVSFQSLPFSPHDFLPMYLCVFSSCKDNSYLGLEPILIWYNLILTWFHVQRAYFQILSNSQVPGWRLQHICLWDNST